METIDRYRREIEKNLGYWRKKPVLKKIYRGFHEMIAQHLAVGCPGLVVELGSGIGNIKEAIPQCIRTDLFPNPWIDRVENAYRLSWPDAAVSNLVLFDVFHHLRYPGTALKEFHRVLVPGGRVILFEPCLSLIGFFAYGVLHGEPLGLRNDIQWTAPDGWSPEGVDYYAAQGNATRIFLRDKFCTALGSWDLLAARRLSAISYLASGGYSKPQLYPDRALPIMRLIERMCDLVPGLFATRLLVVLEKRRNV